MEPAIVETLSRLVSFRTVSREPNLALLDYVESLLEPAGVRIERFAYRQGAQDNLWASVGPEGPGGVVLSAHSDVVPVDGQAWTSDPFALRRDGDRLFGRGTADMKGFVAVAVQALVEAASKPLTRPLHLALSCDEEVGCLGVRPMIEAIAKRAERPALCLVGEPTGMRLALGHKGKLSLRATCQGREGHSALAPLALNALHLGAAFITKLRERQEALAARGAQDAAYDVPFSTIHAGIMQGGTALNIVPASCTVDFEIRHLAADDPERLVAELKADAEALALPFRARFPEARIKLERLSGYPGLDTAADSEAARLLQSLLPAQEPPIKVAFGTEGGLFHQGLGIPVLVCGPGHMAQGHRPDEFVALDQLSQCQALLRALTRTLCH